MKRLDKQKGITLVALVITIIILLILAGVAISLTIGNGGLIEMAKKAKEENNKQAAIEKIEFKITEFQMRSFANGQTPTLQGLADTLYEDDEIEYIEIEARKENVEPIIKQKVDLGENKSFFTKLKEYPYEFEINDSLQIVSLDGIKIDHDENSKGEENSFRPKELTWITSSRTGCTIPSGITEAYVILGTGTNSSSATLTISGSIIKSQVRVAVASELENYGVALRSTVSVYKLELTGEEGSITISASGGSGGRSWTSIVMY